MLQEHKQLVTVMQCARLPAEHVLCPVSTSKTNTAKTDAYLLTALEDELQLQFVLGRHQIRRTTTAAPRADLQVNALTVY